jgi:hypothetical protein
MRLQMELSYLLFDDSDDGNDRGSFDAMASVLPERLAALLEEIERVLRWAHEAFGPAAAASDEGDWDFDLQGSLESGASLEMAYDPAHARVSTGPAVPHRRITVTLTVSGSAAFCEAFRGEFALE